MLKIMFANVVISLVLWAIKLGLLLTENALYRVLHELRHS